MNVIPTPMTVVSAASPSLPSEGGSPSDDADGPGSTEERSPRAERRAAIGARFLEALEEIVNRHRTMEPSEHGDLQAELIAAEVAHQLALVRSQLARAPHLRG